MQGAHLFAPERRVATQPSPRSGIVTRQLRMVTKWNAAGALPLTNLRPCNRELYATFEVVPTRHQRRMFSYLASTFRRERSGSCWPRWLCSGFWLLRSRCCFRAIVTKPDVLKTHPPTRRPSTRPVQRYLQGQGPRVLLQQPRPTSVIGPSRPVQTDRRCVRPQSPSPSARRMSHFRVPVSRLGGITDCRHCDVRDGRLGCFDVQRMVW